jgi:excisionase family DNA binding protein
MMDLSRQNGVRYAQGIVRGAVMEETKPERLFLKPSEAAQMIGVSRAKIYELISSGAIPSKKIGDSGMIRVPLAGLKRLVDEALQAS